MAVGLKPAKDLLPIAGIELSATSAGIYKKKRDDLILISFPESGTVGAVFTRNLFAAAPVKLARQHLKKSNTHRYCLINAGNANAGTGEKGFKAAVNTCSHLADLTGYEVESILPFSTGVIGMDLPVEKINAAMPALLESLDHANWELCANAIMTTDTVAKGCSKQFRLDNQTVTITGIAKGSGMIRPDMATMLAFIGTDAGIDKSVIDLLMAECVATTFNRICVDGDMSTNDACVLISTGMSKAPRIDSVDHHNYQIIKQALHQVFETLAMAIVRDGEGATKFVAIHVSGGHSEKECLDVAYAVARSPLVKTAFFASDPNWGRILAAVGYAGIRDLDISTVNIFIGNTCIVKNGARAEAYTEELGVSSMAGEEIDIRIELGRGDYGTTVWTCDLSHDYVRINAEYRS